MKKFICARNIHPGEILRVEIEYRKLSKKELAKQMDIPYKVLNGILNERKSLTIETATRFKAVLGITVDFLLRMQTEYDMRAANESKAQVKLLDRLRKKL